jgi:hypothetical protein
MAGHVLIEIIRRTFIVARNEHLPRRRDKVPKPRDAGVSTQAPLLLRNLVIDEAMERK